jgi:hypothetical protein
LKTVLATISDETHAALEKLKAKNGWANNNEAVEALIRTAAQEA